MYNTSYLTHDPADPISCHISTTTLANEIT